jgi:hypothetical protein
MLRSVAVIALFLIKIVSYVVSFDAYKNMIEGLLSNNAFISVQMRLQTIFFLWTEGLAFSLVAVTLFAPSLVVKDKAYKLLRIVVVTYFLFALPFYIASWFIPANITDFWTLAFIVSSQAITIFCVFVFLFAKPPIKVHRIDTSEYELVEHSSTSHRFIHSLLDTLVMIPVLFQMAAATSYSGYGRLMNLLAVTLFYSSFFIYYFFNEAVFGQTFGKVFTNSVVAGQGRPLSGGRLLMRSLFRYIPVNAFTFLFGANWHDKLSSTTVIYSNSWEKLFTDPGQEPEATQKPA